MEGRRLKGKEEECGYWWYVRELEREECLCGGGKQRGKSFCYRCFRLLPLGMQDRLYHRLGQGYEEAFAEAETFLREKVW